MNKYSSITESAQNSIDSVPNTLSSVYLKYKEQIIDLSKEESNLIAFEYIEELQAKLCLARIEEGIRKNKKTLSSKLI